MTLLCPPDTGDSKFDLWRSEAKHATPKMLNLYETSGKETFVCLKLECRRGVDRNFVSSARRLSVKSHERTVVQVRRGDKPAISDCPTVLCHNMGLWILEKVNNFSAGILDVRFWRLKTIPALKGIKNIIGKIRKLYMLLYWRMGLHNG